jgi:virginiamycin B lyase
MRYPFALSALLSVLTLHGEVPKTPKPAHPVKPGVKKPGVQIPIAELKPDAVFETPGSPDWLAVGDNVWVSNKPKNSVMRLDPKTNKVVESIAVGSKPCSGLAIGFGSLWVPNCGDQTVSRVDLKTGKVTATFPSGIGNTEGYIAAGAGSIWMMTDAKGTLARIDPDTNKVVAEILVPSGSYCPVFGENAVWVTSTEGNSVSRIDPNTNLVVETIPVGKAPRFLAVGEGAVWTLNQTDGNVTRIDPKTNQVVATIEVGVPGGGGDIAAGEGSVWVTSFGFPISRIDPASNKVVQQFTGEGGDAIRVGLGSVWLSNLKAGTVWRIDPKRIEACVAPELSSH